MKKKRTYIIWPSSFTTDSIQFNQFVTRGTLLAIGRPDGRILSLLKTERTVMLAAKQAAFVENFGVGPEIFTVGHNNVKVR